MNEKCCVSMGPILNGYSTMSVGSYDDLIRTYMIIVTRNDTVRSLCLEKTQLSQHFPSCWIGCRCVQNWPL
jgi:hypothetical protein